MVAIDRNSVTSAEAAMKYFVLGAIASGCLLYGISWVYGVTGSLQFHEIAAAIRMDPTLNSLPLWFGLAFLIVGIGFKFGAVPFHMWLPDVYQGARTPVTLYIASAPKLAALALTCKDDTAKVFRHAFPLLNHSCMGELRAQGFHDDGPEMVKVNRKPFF